MIECTLFAIRGLSIATAGKHCKQWVAVLPYQVGGTVDKAINPCVFIVDGLRQHIAYKNLVGLYTSVIKETNTRHRLPRRRGKAFAEQLPGVAGDKPHLAILNGRANCFAVLHEVRRNGGKIACLAMTDVNKIVAGGVDDLI